MQRAVHLLALCALVLCAFAPAVHGLENIAVISPPDLAYLNPLFDSPAMFGIPSYQSAVIGRLLYLEPYDGCSAITLPPNTTDLQSFILLIDRGTCHFTTKIWNAQLAGSPVKAVIVADNVDNELYPPMMQDDGLGSKINIPSVMIRKSDADALKTNLTNNATDPVQIRMEWRVPRPDNTVTWELWTSSNNAATRELISTFGSIMDALGDRVQFTPYYYVLPGTNYSPMPGSLSGNLCTNNNQYCTDSPVPVTSGGRQILSGLPVIQQNVNQICLWRYLASQGNQRLWWSIVNEWNNFIAESNTNFDDPHLDLAMRQYGISRDAIAGCITASGGISSSISTPNTIAIDMIKNATQRRVIMPAVYANGDVYRGSFSCPSPPSLDTCGILQFICSNFAKDARPSACAVTGCPIGQVKDNCGVCGGQNLCQQSPSSSGVKTEAVVGVIIVIVFVLVAGGVYWNRRHQQQMRSDLDTILATYVRIDENGQPRRPTEKNLPLSIHQDRNREGDDQATDNIRLL